MTTNLELNLAGHPLGVAFQYPETRRYFWPFLRRASLDRKAVICASTERIARARPLLPPDSASDYVEFRTLIGLCSLALLEWDCCLFHAVAFRWQGKAFLLTAPSGTGKTTQFRNWQRQFPGEVEMICGDMPVLEPREDGSLWVYPSPWNGKENLRGAAAAPAAGLVLLQQGPENRVEPMTGPEAVLPCLKQLLVQPETEDQIQAMSRLLNRLLGGLPLRRMVNRGDEASTDLLRQTLAPFIPEREEA